MLIWPSSARAGSAPAVRGGRGGGGGRRAPPRGARRGQGGWCEGGSYDGSPLASWPGLSRPSRLIEHRALLSGVPGSSPGTTSESADAPSRFYEHPVVLPHVSHFMQVPLRTRVKLPHSPQASPS